MKKALILIASLLIFINGYSQKYSNNSLLGSVGVGVSDNLKADGEGIYFGIGYQKDILGNRLRFVPVLTFGTFKSSADDASYAYFQSSSLRVNLNFDIIKIKSFSIFIGTGVTGNYSSGLKSGRGYFKETHFGLNGLFGLRINPLKKRIGYELKIIDLTLEPSYQEGFFEGGVFRFRLLIKLNKL